MPEQTESGTDHQSSHYQDNVRLLTALGDVKSVVAAEDIYSASGAKLLAKGAAINSERQILLLKHKLNKPLDLMVEISEGVSSAVLREHARALLQSPVSAGGLKGLLWGDQACDALCTFPLRTVAANKLTLIHCNWPNLFTHLVRTGLLAAALAHQLRLLPEREALLAGAGLLHDIGMLHLDPELANDKNYSVGLDTAQLQRLQVHPMLGSFLLTLDGYPADLRLWVAQHHERADGSGYPRGSGVQRFSLEAEVLALAEIMISQLERGLVSRMVVTIKSFAEKQFGSQLCCAALAVVDALAVSADITPHQDRDAASRLARDLEGLQALIREGGDLLSGCPGAAQVFHRLAVDFTRTGISSPMVPELLVSIEDTCLYDETQALTGEYLYRLRPLLHEFAAEVAAVSGGQQWQERLQNLLQCYR